MKISLSSALVLMLSSRTYAFPVLPSGVGSSSHQQQLKQQQTIASTQLFMFGGAGAGTPAEDDEAGEEAMKNSAAAMGMPLGEYKLALQAKQYLVNAMDIKIVTGGKADTVMVERDVNNPPKNLEIKITPAGKAQGKETVSKDLVTALKSASDAARMGRQEAQQEMLKWVQGQVPK
jgi:hypothetical protein